MRDMGMNATGVILRDSETGTDYGVHDECLQTVLDALGEVANPFSADYRIATIGPLFAPQGEWNCASTGCAL